MVCNVVGHTSVMYRTATVGHARTGLAEAEGKTARAGEVTAGVKVEGECSPNMAC